MIHQFSLIASDLDGTLTWKGQLSPSFLSLTHFIQNNDKHFLIVTGRSYGWGLFLLTHYPLRAIIVENGGMFLWKDSNGNIHEKKLISPQKCLETLKLKQLLIKKFSEKILTKDSHTRITDLAISLKNPMRVQAEEYLDAKRIFYKKSNVHINVAPGKQNKWKAFKKVQKKHFPNLSLEEICYFGDSLNDQEMFSHIPFSFGVSNIKKCLSSLDSPPQYILNGARNLEIKGVFRTLKGLNPLKDLL